MSDTVDVEQQPVAIATGDLEEVVATVVGDRIIFVKIVQDQDVDSPLESGTSNGNIYSLSSRHSNFDTEAVREAMQSNPDAVPLSYFEHGSCIWFPKEDAGRHPGVEFQWDGVEMAGVWVPDEEVLSNVRGILTAENHPSREDGKELTRAEVLLRYARDVCEQYTDYCNGAVFGYDVEVFALRSDDDEPLTERSDYANPDCLHSDSCFGFYGWEYAIRETEEAARNLLLQNESPKVKGPSL